MTEEKELVRRIKNSFKAKQSHAEIIRRLQKRGYKLEYINALMKKAGSTKRFLIISFITIIILASLAIAAYSLIFSKQKQDLANPLAGFNVNFNEKSTMPEGQNQTAEEVYIEDIEITPEFISYLLNEIGAWQLHKNPLTLEEPVINFKIDEQEFNSVIDGTIETSTGLSESADMQFNTNKEDIVRAILSETPDAVFKESLQNDRTQIEVIAGEPELFAKGYLKLYDSLK